MESRSNCLKRLVFVGGGYARCAVHPEGPIIGLDYEYVLGV
jgi:hypothetical protein